MDRHEEIDLFTCKVRAPTSGDLTVRVGVMHELRGGARRVLMVCGGAHGHGAAGRRDFTRVQSSQAAQHKQKAHDTIVGLGDGQLQGDVDAHDVLDIENVHCGEDVREGGPSGGAGAAA